jgi:hypothetical protein
MMTKATSHHPTHLKICLEALASPRGEQERGNEGANELGSKVGCHPLPTKLYGGNYWHILSYIL